ncbi:DUF1854 domain-containing protein [Lederbergia wuyishanensis]|uniref:DUF1854 domain-containing protein n=1 Tax=Lederbergia wuyishanensis TaxID=1347903 RepID=A0ABU0D2Z5_9BACI|nr:DUF1854 domain-containing protein [Lederbergia wuyishanensis]MCJ8007082.1 DUF1854 domain-containing protein [Lederbergia wuyishanensis]MDQ0342774.1 hypothetical protein [Lederbergia wuyishanensis]
MTKLNIELTGHDLVETKSDLAEAAKMKYLTKENTVFLETEGHMLTVHVDGEIYPAVFLHCSFPHMNNRIFISVRTGENEEIGMIKSLDEFPSDTVTLLEEHIHLRYFAPEITKINKINEEFGYSYWDTETRSGTCYFTVRSGRGNVTVVTANRVLVTDVDGNRFIIKDLNDLTEKEYRMVEMLMA